jgi:transposase-like protein
MSVLSAPHFHNEEAAYERLESLVWPNGPVCPHCGNTDVKRFSKIKGKSARPGLRTCLECRKQFTVKVGTVFESSHIPLHKWFQAAHLMASSKKGISAHQLHRTLQVTYKTAWFMAHRLREAMRVMNPMPIGGEGKVVEADETYFGDNTREGVKLTKHGKRGLRGKRAVLALVERGGSVRTFHVDEADKETVNEIMSKNVARESYLATDESRLYSDAWKHVADHLAVRHSIGEYVREDVHTNTVEGYFSIFKRGMKGVYQHCSEKHLHRYLAEFDFRYCNRVALGVHDDERTGRALRGIIGKRLTYR